MRDPVRKLVTELVPRCPRDSSQRLLCLFEGRGDTSSRCPFRLRSGRTKLTDMSLGLDQQHAPVFCLGKRIPLRSTRGSELGKRRRETLEIEPRQKFGVAVLGHLIVGNG